MDGYVRIGTQLDTKDFDAEIKYIESQLDEIEHKLKQADMGFEVGDTQKLEAQYSKLIKQLDRLQKKQADLNKTDLTEVQKNIDKVGNSVSKTISKVGKWALAVFGVRSAYMFVRQSASTLAQYNEQIASDLNYMQFALASMLQPVIERLIQLAYKLLTYVNYIAKAWFGVDLFANASADAMNKSAKSAEKMKKSLAGFDEMNVLNDNGSTGAMGAVTPSLDLATPEDVPIPSWIQWIADNKDILIAGLTGIAGGLMAIYLGLTLIQGLGIGLILAGVALAIQGIIDFIKDPSWHNFLTILQGVALVVAGIAVLMGGWVVALIALGVAIVSYVIQNWDKVKEILGKVGTWIYENIVIPVWNFIQGLFDTILSIIKTAISVINGIFTTLINIIANPFIVAYDTVVGVFNGIKKTIQGVFDVIAGLFTGDWKRVMNGFKNIFKGVFDTLWSIAKAPLNLIIGGINALIKGANKISFDVPDWVPGLGGKKFGFNIPTIPKLAVGGIVNMPSRGVPIGGAIAGESGAEGVIPLTNSQAMETLGQAIGKYININATVPVYVGNKQIAREIKKINAESDFAFNR